MISNEALLNQIVAFLDDKELVKKYPNFPKQLRAKIHEVYRFKKKQEESQKTRW